MTLKVPSQLASGEDALKALLASAVLASIAMDQTAKDNFVSAVREVLWNAIEHGGRLDPAALIQIDLLHSNRAISCFVKDPGPGFNPKLMKHAAINNPEDNAVQHALLREAAGLRPGGYGIMLAGNFVEEMIYNELGNEVVLVKDLS